MYLEKVEINEEEAGVGLFLCSYEGNQLQNGATRPRRKRLLENIATNKIL